MAVVNLQSVDCFVMYVVCFVECLKLGPHCDSNADNLEKVLKLKYLMIYDDHLRINAFSYVCKRRIFFYRFTFGHSSQPVYQHEVEY